MYIRKRKARSLDNGGGGGGGGGSTPIYAKFHDRLDAMNFLYWFHTSFYIIYFYRLINTIWIDIQ